MRPPAPVPPELLRLAERQEGLLSAGQCNEAGVGERRREVLVRRGAWSRVTRGVFATGAICARDGPPDARRRRSAWLALLAYGQSSVAVGACALALHGVAGLPLAIQPEAAVARGRHRNDRDGIRLREFDNGMETVVVSGRQVASVTWALAQAVPELDRAHGVAVMDSALNQGLIDEAGLHRAHDLARGRRGVARTHSWWAEADGRAESPLETFARLDCADLGVPPDDLQVVLTDERGLFVARGDLGWRIGPGRWLVAEIDGREWHESPEALLRDRRRQNAIVRSNVADVLRFTADDLREPGAVGSQVLLHLRRARGYLDHLAR